ncbi:glycosyltransferase family 87 protein [Pedobacter sp. SYP-B3415]|uniref:glycosyltransferase family 87 protein n=1 Tax=Pedobacter sp. SYP-B3415 TaxID=2496641 RepID=UPI001F113540|nr:glycosyltransferase family 87 protein [Pedobacter sp. SYP-B3415]
MARIFLNTLGGKISGLLMSRTTLLVVYLTLAAGSALKQYLNHAINNYLIFKYTFWHSLRLQPLYPEYPAEYLDSNHYGPFFAVIIAPFALLPDWAGVILWNIFNTAVLFYAIWQLPVSEYKRKIILWICSHELLTALLSVQFNVAITGFIVLSFCYLERQRLFPATVSMMLGLFTKLYGIVGLAFFFFIRHKWRFIGTFVGIFITFVVLPAILSNLDFVWNAYRDWYQSLVLKNSYNQGSDMADISFFGFLRRTTGLHVNVLYGCLIAAILLGFALLRYKQHISLQYRLMTLCYVLLCLVLFNTNVESPTYIIAFVGVAIWFTLVPKNPYTISLLIFAILLTSFSPSDLFPRFVREEYVKPYALKALPCILIWFDIAGRVLFANFLTSSRDQDYLNQPNINEHRY